MHKLTVLATSALIGLTSIQAQAGGFQIGEQGSKAMGMGNAFTAIADDPSAQWFNPAGSAFQQGTQVMGGGEIIIVPEMKFTTNSLNPSHPSNANMKSKTLVVPHLYASHAIADTPVTVGIGINSPFGLESDWPATSPFATSNTFSQIKTINFNPNVTWKINDNLAIAGGVDYVLLDKVRLNNSAQLLEGKGDGWGGNLAVMYRDDRFSAGVTWRSAVKLKIDNGTVIGGSALALLGAPGLVGARGSASTQVVLPDQVNVGLAYKPNEDLTLSLDIDWVNWKTFDNLDFRYAPSALATGLTGGTNFRTLKENWSSTVAFRAGADWRVNQAMSLRGGYTFDPTPVDALHYTPGIPDRDRHLFTIGMGYDVSPAITFDVAYMFVYFVDQNQTLSTGTDAVRNGNYSGNVHILAGSAVYRF